MVLPLLVATVLTLPAIIGSAIAAVAFGPSLIGVGAFYQMSAESAPIGHVEVEQLSYTADDKGLHHSSYDDARAWRAIASWVTRSQQVPMTEPKRRRAADTHVGRP